MKKIISGQNLNESPAEKLKRFAIVEKAYGEFLTALGYDWENDPNMFGTPKRVTKMYLNEITQGTYDKGPKITSFPNQGQYTGMVMQGNIDVKSLCSHHIQPFVGKCHIAYIPGETVIGLSKLNRIVAYYARRPQLQEQLTQQIHDHLNKIMKGNQGIAVHIEANHMCVALRGVNEDSQMSTVAISGDFKEKDAARAEFYSLVKRK